MLQVPSASCSADNEIEPPRHQDEQTQGLTDCLSDLALMEVKFDRPGATVGVVTPVLVKGALGAVSLEQRGDHAALMDCSLARELATASPIFAALGLTRLAFSAAYDHRTRRGSTKLSAHAFGQAIDVHVFDGRSGRHDVKTDFEAGVGRWLGIVPGQDGLDECIGSPVTDRGRRLRTLVCRLKLQTELRVIVTPDDNEDHRDHIHLEYAAPRVYVRKAAAAEPTARTVAVNAPAKKVTPRADAPFRMTKAKKKVRRQATRKLTVTKPKAKPTKKRLTKKKTTATAPAAARAGKKAHKPYVSP